MYFKVFDFKLIVFSAQLKIHFEIFFNSIKIHKNFLSIKFNSIYSRKMNSNISIAYKQNLIFAFVEKKNEMHTLVSDKTE